VDSNSPNTPGSVGSARTNRRKFLATGAVMGAAALVSPGLASAGGRRGGWPGPGGAPGSDGFTVTSVVTDELIINVRSIGTGDPIVIFPSLARGSLDFDPLALLLAGAGFQVVAIDPRGVGQTWTPTGALSNINLDTLAADMYAVIGQLGLGSVHVLGHAYGNRVARDFTVAYPEITKSVILCACGGGVNGAPPTPVASAGLATVLNPASTPAQIEENVKATFFAAGSDASPWYTGWYPAAGVAEGAAFAATDFTTEIEGGGDKPLLVIQGNEDIVAQPSIGHELREKFGPRVKVWDLDDAGHAMIIERTATVANIIIQNLRSGGPRRESGATFFVPAGEDPDYSPEGPGHHRPGHHGGRW
jgi:pimeloyl-ACP methyl ester carboxylesterase